MSPLTCSQAQGCSMSMYAVGFKAGNPDFSAPEIFPRYETRTEGAFEFRLGVPLPSLARRGVATKARAPSISAQGSSRHPFDCVGSVRVLPSLSNPPTSQRV